MHCYTYMIFDLPFKNITHFLTDVICFVFSPDIFFCLQASEVFFFAVSVWLHICICKRRKFESFNSRASKLVLILIKLDERYIYTCWISRKRIVDLGIFANFVWYMVKLLYFKYLRCFVGSKVGGSKPPRSFH